MGIVHIVRYKRLRHLSIAGLIVLCAANDVIFGVQFTFTFFEAIRSARNASTTYQLCSLEKIGESDSHLCLRRREACTSRHLRLI